MAGRSHDSLGNAPGRIGLSTGPAPLQNPVLYKGTAFTDAERDALGLRGLLPLRVCTQDEQVERVLENLRQEGNTIEKCIYILSLQDRNETLFYRVVLDNPVTLLPLVYTPTVFNDDIQGTGAVALGGLLNAWRISKRPARDNRVLFVGAGEAGLGIGESKCTAEEAVVHTAGRRIFALGSPLPPVRAFGRPFRPSQCNNVYIFPGLGLGALLSGARRLSTAVFAVAARTLASLAQEDELAAGCVYPAIGRIREVSVHIAAAVTREVRAEGMPPGAWPADALSEVQAAMYQPVYGDYVL